MKRILLATLLAVGVGACRGKELPPLQIPTSVAQNRSFTVTAEATGRIEPIQIIDIKSKAGGQITKMFVESGFEVKRGDTIVILDPRDVQAAYTQAEADLKSAQARLENSMRLREQNLKLLEASVITKRDMEASELDVTSQQSNVIRSEQARELARQRLEDAVIKAPSDGTILEKIVSEGTVIASASNSASGGTTLVKMANLNRVRARVYVSETDIGKVQLGMETTVKVDAFPNKNFVGTVEKMEPQAIVDQNVTMFPVIVSLDNEERALMPGMNGEISILVDTKNQVLTIPLDAFRLTNEARTVAEMFGISPEKVDTVAREGNQQRGMTPIGDDSSSQVPVGRGAPPGAANGRGGAATGGAPNGGGANGGRMGGNGAAGGGANARGGNAPGGRGGGVEVTDADCKLITDAITKKAGMQKQIDDLRTQMSAGGDRRALNEQINALYTAAGIDNRVAGSCRMREALAAGGGAAGGRGGNRGGGRGGRGGNRGGGGAGDFGSNLGQRNGGLGVRGQGLASSGIVFVKVGEDTTVKPAKVIFEARFVRLGAQNYDYAEVTQGLKAGETVAMLAAAKIAIQRQQQAEKQKQNSSLIPGMGGGQQGRGMPGMDGGGAPRGGGGPPAGGGGPGGGGGGGGGGRGRGGD